MTDWSEHPIVADALDRVDDGPEVHREAALEAAHRAESGVDFDGERLDGTSRLIYAQLSNTFATLALHSELQVRPI